MTFSRLFGPAERMDIDGVAVDFVWDTRIKQRNLLASAVAALDTGGVIAIMGDSDAAIHAGIDQLLPLLGGGHA